MTFSAFTYQIDGGNTASQLWRQALDAACLGSPGGIVNPLDCVVSCSGTNNIILIADGKFAIQGAEVADQGTYFGYNVGQDNSLTIAATGGSPRSDMIVARVEDPTFAGSPWSGSVTAETIFPRVISGVSSSATVPPGGQSAIALARVDMPASTSVVLQSYIHDLRYMINARRQKSELQAAGSSTVAWTLGTTATAWPSLATWQVAIPSWATGVKMRWVLGNVVYVGGGTNWARGNVGPVFGTSVTSPNQAFPTTLVSVNTASTTYEVMGIYGSADTSVSTALRGTTQTLQFAQTTDGTQTGIIDVTEGSVFIVELEFIQLPVTV